MRNGQALTRRTKLELALAAAWLLLPAAAFALLTPSNEGLPGLLGGLVVGAVGGAALMVFAVHAASDLRREPAVRRSAGFVALAHLIGFPLGGIIAGLASGMIAPCHGADTVALLPGLAWLGVFSTATGLVLSNVTKSALPLWGPLLGAAAAAACVSELDDGLWLGVLAWAACTLTSLELWARQPLKNPPPDRCPNCRYLLTGLDSRPCPECGAPPASPPAPPTPT